MTIFEKIKEQLAAKGPMTGLQLSQATGVELGVMRATLSKAVLSPSPKHGPIIEKLGKKGEDGPFRLRPP